MSQTVKEFINDYHGFDFENGEIVIVDQRGGKQIICHMAELNKNCIEDDRLNDSKYLCSQGTNASFWISRVYHMEVWNWTHTAKTILIIC